MTGRVCDVNTPSATLTVNEQSELDALEGCERIAGSLTLRAFSGMDPSPLRRLRRVDGSLRVDARRAPEAAWRGSSASGSCGTAVSNLDAFAGLRQLGELELNGDPQLTQLDGLAGLQQLRSAYIWSNDQLRSLPVFTALEGVACSGCPEELIMQINDNPNLQTGPGLPSLQTAQAIHIANDARLTSLAGLATLLTVSHISVERNRKPGHARAAGAEPGGRSAHPLQSRAGRHAPRTAALAARRSLCEDRVQCPWPGRALTPPMAGRWRVRRVRRRLRRGQRCQRLHRAAVLARTCPARADGPARPARQLR